MLGRRVKRDVSKGNSRSQWNAEGLNGTIEVLVIKRVLIVPHAIAQVGYFVTHKPDTIVARIGFELAHRCAGPGFDGGLFSHGGTGQRKAESGRSTGDSEWPVGSVVIHVTLARVSLAPGVFVRDDVLRFGKIGGARVLCRDQVTRFHQNSVGGCVMTVTGVIVREITVETSGERIDPGARTDASLAAVQTGSVCVRAAGAKVAAIYAIASEPAGV